MSDEVEKYFEFNSVRDRFGLSEWQPGILSDGNFFPGEAWNVFMLHQGKILMWVPDQNWDPIDPSDLHCMKKIEYKASQHGWRVLHEL